MNLVTAQQMQEIDKRAQTEYGIPGLILMEQAGVKGFHTAVELLDIPRCSSLLFIAGSGNNGGDAFVMAREAWNHGFCDCVILKTKTELQETASLQAGICAKIGIPIFDASQDDWKTLIDQAEYIFDGMVGTGLKGPLRTGILTEIIEYLNAADSRSVVALDIPSGMSDPAEREAVILRSDLTVTFGANKQVFYLPSMRMYCGEIICINPGFPKDLLDSYSNAVNLMTETDSISLEACPPDSYKNRKGHVAVFAGSPGYTGAAALASDAALRAGAGLVTLFCDEEIYPIMAANLRSVIVRPIPSDEIITAQTLKDQFDAVLAGPGWGLGSARMQQLEEILSSDIPTVLDADAIRILRAIHDAGWYQGHGEQLILTPHPGEFRALYQGEKDSFFERLQETAGSYDAVVLYKSHLNYIVDPEGPIMVIEGLNPKMGTAGSGDVLAGILSSMVLRESDAADAALLGNTIHQRTGEVCRDSLGTFIAEDLVHYIGIVVEELENR